MIGCTYYIYIYSYVLYYALSYNSKYPNGALLVFIRVIICNI